MDRGILIRCLRPDRAASQRRESPADGGTRRRARWISPKWRSGARIQEQVGRGASSRDDERDYGLWDTRKRGEGYARWRGCSVGRRRANGHAREREGEGKVNSEGSHRDAELLRRLVEVRERRSGAICSGTELEQSSNGGGDLGLGFARRRLRLGETKGVVWALFIGPVGDPWRAGQGAARGGVWRPDSLSPRRPRGGRRPRQAGPACRRQRGGGADLGRKRKVGWWKGGVWAAGEEKKKGRGRWAGPAGLKTRERKDFAFLKLNQTIQFKLKFREFKFEPNNKQ